MTPAQSASRSDLTGISQFVSNTMLKIFTFYLRASSTPISDYFQRLWWLHVSYNLCEGDGEPNVYRKAGVFQCAHQKAGWEGDNPPYKDTRAWKSESRFRSSKSGQVQGCISVWLLRIRCVDSSHHRPEEPFLVCISCCVGHWPLRFASAPR